MTDALCVVILQDSIIAMHMYDASCSLFPGFFSRCTVLRKVTFYCPTLTDELKYRTKCMFIKANDNDADTISYSFSYKYLSAMFRYAAGQTARAMVFHHFLHTLPRKYLNLK